ncbi:MAG: hypothetical protein FWH55_11410 [Oscillospiraceae bacterium]|nr:hypothetical protein [Oscillospiraceae bacterium]
MDMPTTQYEKLDSQMMARLADEGDPVAQVEFANRLFYGLGIERDLDRAWYYLKMSSKQGNVRAW